MPAGLKKLTVGHSRDMDTEGVYGHVMAGDLEKAAGFAEEAFKKILQVQKCVGTFVGTWLKKPRPF